METEDKSWQGLVVLPHHFFLFPMEGLCIQQSPGGKKICAMREMSRDKDEKLSKNRGRRMGSFVRGRDVAVADEVWAWALAIESTCQWLCWGVR